jgi:pentatricopeptide repeat protein
MTIFNFETQTCPFIINCKIGYLRQLLTVITDVALVSFLFSFQIGKVAKALSISKEMESCGIKHNNKTYSMLINGFIHLHDFANAFAIFEEMLRSGLQPDRAIYNLLIEAFCKMGNMDRAICILEKMQKERMQPSNRAFRPIIEGYAVAGDMKSALDTLDLMRRSGCVPTVMTYNALIHGLVRKHKVFFKYMLVSSNLILSCGNYFKFVFIGSKSCLCA